MNPKYIVAIEIGSSLIKGAIGAIDKTGTLKVCAVEQRDIIDCVRYGCIQNVEEVRATVADIVISLESRVNISPRKVKAVYVSLGGRSFVSYKRDLEISFENETAITNEVIDQLLEKARVEIFGDKEIVDVAPSEFIVDNMKHNNPIGTYGHNLKVSLNIVACRPQIIKNMNRVIEEKLQLQINDYIVRQMAISQLVLTSKEMQLGCVLVDFGAETTTVSVHKSGVLQSLVTIPLGSRNITRDLITLGTTEEHAEKVKCSYVNVKTHESIGVNQGVIDGIDDLVVFNYIHCRVVEIVANIIAQVKNSGYKSTDLPGGIVVVGRGAKLNGFNALLESNGSYKVRSGMVPAKIQIADNSIQPNDVIDVIAVLYAASQSNQDAIIDCLTELPVSAIENDVVEISSKSNDLVENEDEQELINHINQENENDDDDEDENYYEEEKNKKGNAKKKDVSKLFTLLKSKLEALVENGLNEDSDDEDDE